MIVLEYYLWISVKFLGKILVEIQWVWNEPNDVLAQMELLHTFESLGIGGLVLSGGFSVVFQIVCLERPIVNISFIMSCYLVTLPQRLAFP